MRRLLVIVFASCVPLPLAMAASGADDIDRSLAAIAAVGVRGAGSAEARVACDRLCERGPEILPRLLTAMESANPVAANWARTAYETIVERELAKADPKFPVDDLRQFVRDPQRAGRVRRLALALCERLEPGYSNKLIRRLLEDPEFRNDAVEMALAAGQHALESGDSETARAEFEQAFEKSRDSSQTVRAADKLTGLGQKVDIAAHLGLVTDWWLLGPFDAPQFTGFAREFPPELGVELRTEYGGQEGRPIHWLRHRVTDPLGLLNLIQALAPAKEAVAYAYAEIESSRDQPCQLRCGADDNCAVWLNSQKVFGREQWLNGTRLDRFVTPVQLQRGTNRVLVKICQGPQHKDPQVPNNWSLQLRFCDDDGAGLRFRSALPEPTSADK